MTGIAPHEAQITGWLAAQKDSMLALLADAVNIDSGSYDKAGVDAVGQRFIDFLSGQGLLTQREPNDTFGDAIHIRLDDTRANEKPILLMGHRDTVFPKGEVARRPFRIADGRAYGPGVADMKAGLVINAFVLSAFKKLGGAPAPLTGLITSDEEIGSPSSRPVIERAARQARCVFNSEPGRPTGAVVTGRKGGVFLWFEVQGRAAHSGGNFEKGMSAIGELAHKVVAIHAPDRPQPRHHLECRHRQGRPVGQHHRAAGRGPDRPALCRSCRPGTRCSRPCRQSSTAPPSPAPLQH